MCLMVKRLGLMIFEEGEPMLDMLFMSMHKALLALPTLASLTLPFEPSRLLVDPKDAAPGLNLADWKFPPILSIDICA